MTQLLGIPLKLTPTPPELYYFSGSSLIISYESGSFLYKGISSESTIDSPIIPRQIGINAGSQLYLKEDLIAIEDTLNHFIYIYDIRLNNMTNLNVPLSENVIQMQYDPIGLLVVLTSTHILLIDTSFEKVKTENLLKSDYPNTKGNFKKDGMILLPQRTQFLVLNSDDSITLYSYSNNKIIVSKEKLFDGEEQALAVMSILFGGFEFVAYEEITTDGTPPSTVKNLRLFNIENNKIINTLEVNLKYSKLKGILTKPKLVMGLSTTKTLSLFDMSKPEKLLDLPLDKNIENFVLLPMKSDDEISFAALLSDGTIKISSLNIKTLTLGTSLLFLKEKNDPNLGLIEDYIMGTSEKVVVRHTSSPKKIFIYDLMGSLINFLEVPNQIDNILQMGKTGYIGVINLNRIDFFDVSEILKTSIPPISSKGYYIGKDAKITISEIVNDDSLGAFVSIYEGAEGAKKITFINNKGVVQKEIAETSTIKFFCQNNNMKSLGFIDSDNKLNIRIIGTSADTWTNTVSASIDKKITHAGAISCFNSDKTSKFYTLTENTLSIWKTDGTKDRDIISVSVNFNYFTSDYLSVLLSTKELQILNYIDGSLSSLKSLTFYSENLKLSLLNIDKHLLKINKNGLFIIQNSFCKADELEYAGVCLLKCPTNNPLDLSTNKCVTSCDTRSFLTKLGETSVCKPCRNVMENCNSCLSSTLCQKCATNYFLYKDLSQKDTCILYKSSVFLSSKDPNVMDGSGLAVQCSSLISDCVVCSWSSSCSRCGLNKYVQFENNLCTDCKQPNQYYLTNALTDGSGQCYECTKNIPNCQNCQNNGATCTLCKDQYFLEAQTCSKCTIDNCRICNKPQTSVNLVCTDCLFGFSLVNNICTPYFYPINPSLKVNQTVEESKFFSWNNSKFLNIIDTCKAGIEYKSTDVSIFWAQSQLETLISAMELKTIMDKLVNGANLTVSQNIYYGYSVNNNLKVPSFQNITGYIRYFCVDKLNKTNVTSGVGRIEYIAKPELKQVLNFYLNFNTAIKNSTTMNVIICILEKMFSLQKVDDKCLTIKNYDFQQRRILQISADSSVTYSFVYLKNPILIDDPFYKKSNDYLSNKTGFIVDFNKEISLNNLSLTLQDLILTNLEDSTISQPDFEVNIQETGNSYARISFMPRNSTGLLLIGSDFNQDFINETAPNYPQFQYGKNYKGNNYNYFQTVLASKDIEFQILFGNLTENKEYMIFYAGKNLQNTKNSIVFNISFVTNESSSDDDIKMKLALGIGIGVGLPCLLIFLYFICYRNNPRKNKVESEGMEEDEKDKAKTKFEYKKPEIDDNESPLALEQHTPA